MWRRRWDSNPRYRCRYGGFQDRCLKPLGHSSLEGRGQKAEGRKNISATSSRQEIHVKGDLQPQAAVLPQLLECEIQRHGHFLHQAVGDAAAGGGGDR